MQLAEFFAKLGLDLDAQSFAKGQLAADAIKGALGLVVDAAKAVGKAMVDMTIGTIKAADHIDEVAQSTGLSTDELQELAYAGSFSSLSMEEMAQSIGFLSKNMEGAASGSKELKATFKELGVSVKNPDGTLRSANDVLGDLADRFAAMPAGPKKVALSMQIFGRAGKQMIPLLNAGRAGLEKFRQEAHRLGVVMDEDLIRRSAEVDDNLNRLEKGWEGIKIAVGRELLPVLSSLTETTLEWVMANREAIASGIKSFFEAMATAARATYDAVVFLVDGVKQFIAEFKKGEGPIFTVVSALLPLVNLLSLLVQKWDAVKAGAMVVWEWLDRRLAPILKLLDPLLQFIAKHWETITKVMRYAMIAVLIPIAAVLASVIAFFVALGAAILTVVSAIADLINWFRGAESTIGSFLEKWGKQLYEGFVQPWVDAATIVRDAFGKAFDWIAAKVQWTLDKVNEGIELLNKLPGVNIGTRRLGDVISAIPTVPGAPGAAPAFSVPGAAPTLEAQAQAGSLSSAVNAVFNITQKPGEDGEQFAQRVARIVADEQERRMREAMAGVLP